MDLLGDRKKDSHFYLNTKNITFVKGEGGSPVLDELLLEMRRHNWSIKDLISFLKTLEFIQNPPEQLDNLRRNLQHFEKIAEHIGIIQK